ncbi:hypothetical protein, partial [Dyella sp.]|uniref:hypothetical protein n=1 Tax=Dyella sp. TaxID=1869338 RepID=UPI002B478824
MKTIHVRRGVLASSLAMALFAPYAVAQTSTTSGSDQQQSTSSNNQQQSSAQNPKELKTVVVTGSMIPRVEVEGPTPV